MRFPHPVSRLPIPVFTAFATLGLTAIHPASAQTTLTSLYAVSCGGNGVTDAQGVKWSADQAYAGVGTGNFGYVNYGYTSIGHGSSTTITIDPLLTPNINDTALYTQNRFYNSNLSGGPDSFDYKFNVIAGEDYTIRLGFADNFSVTDHPGGRIFSYTIDGITGASNFDIANTSGASFPTIKAVEEDYSNIIAPSNGVLDLTFSQGSVNNAQINAIQVLSKSLYLNNNDNIIVSGTGTSPMCQYRMRQLTTLNLSLFRAENGRYDVINFA